jgi:hypothetical protein
VLENLVLNDSTTVETRTDGTRERVHSVSVRQQPGAAVFDQADNWRTCARMCGVFCHRGACEMFFVQRFFSISWPAVSAIRFAPLVTRAAGASPDDSVAHHINLCLCTGETGELPPVTMRNPELMRGRCDQLVW